LLCLAASNIESPLSAAQAFPFIVKLIVAILFLPLYLIRREDGVLYLPAVIISSGDRSADSA
jgi:hypothetical protein